MKIKIGSAAKSIGNAALSIAVTAVLQAIAEAAAKKLAQRHSADD